MRFTFAILAPLLALPAFGQWNRYASAGKEEWSEIAAPHPLSYFTGEARLRDDNGSVGCDYCTAGEKEKILTAARADVAEVGKVGAYTVYDVFYYFDPAREIAGGRSILVKTGPDQYREILYHGNVGWPENPGPAKIVGKAPNQMLWTATSYGGMGLVVDEEFWIGTGSSIKMDIEAVRTAQEETMKSAGFNPREHLKYFGLTQFEARGPEFVSRMPMVNASGVELGSIDVGFRITRGRAIVTSKRYVSAQRP